ncbi:efflux RND transporter periplasmic adaptor subunit [Undibacterium cyanobacteriorum]|uniref:Efflux RND transporter periplasmic adaptor subunit n=1 Tax=Undibacterium cyanobacteriorum TaxID=3073561 RepID=A0ABY9RF36_9BURK|nr:efflux RND transporter periplasmic adaptor subunit [Undibacterium sp. 20NA77.5]WMW79835.1 efflux RND transporter periplasmic adaptor subunit [Undibacterium sp. 20NA77.5]
MKLDKVMTQTQSQTSGQIQSQTRTSTGAGLASNLMLNSDSSSKPNSKLKVMVTLLSLGFAGAALGLSFENTGKAAGASPSVATQNKPSTAATAVTESKRWATVPVRGSNDSARLTVDGVVEAVKTAEIAPQVAGVVQQIMVQAGDPIKQGQVLAHIDARAAQQELSASRANIEALKANVVLAEKDFERQKALFEKNYISQAQLDRAAAVLKSSTAQAQAQIAQASAVQTQSSFYTLKAPFDGFVAAMPSAPGQMAMPGKPVMTVYDPRYLRVMVNVPQARLAMLNKESEMKIEFPSLPASERFVKPKAMTILPVSDATTHTVQVRFDLANAPKSIVPGLFARVNLEFSAGPGAAGNTDTSKDALNQSSAQRLYVPRSAVVRRAEVYAVYVVNAQGKPLMRQVKPGPVSGAEQEILSGLAAGEVVVRDAMQVFSAK